ncbi:MAG: hypothetical protein ACYC7A_11420 [Thermoanaerobaculia bacterium]
MKTVAFSPSFEHWLAALLGQPDIQIRELLRDNTALEFLIVWSLFESKCCRGFLRHTDIDDFAERLFHEGYDSYPILAVVARFHQRYQDGDKYRHLMHGQTISRMKALLRSSVQSLSDVDRIYFMSVVAYRYRNNMFHGNKGVRSWLNFSEQISDCSRVLQTFITHSETQLQDMTEA